MWHEARKQEKKIRGLLVDYKRRAERRKEYYERIKLDPTQFIQLHGRNCKIHLDPAIHHAAEAPGSMMPWRGNMECLIDRFDVRAHLDEIPQVLSASASKTQEELFEERQTNYERYRILVQNEFLDITEDKFLHQIRIEELYGPVTNKAIEEEKKLLAPKKAAIGFCYSEPSANTNEISQDSLDGVQMDEDKDEDSDDSDSDLDLDLTVDILSLNLKQHVDLNTRGMEYGMQMEDFMCLMQRDLDEAEALRIAKEHEDEKAMYSGRKSRKERRALKKKHLDRRLSPPSYAARCSPTYAPYHRSSSRSRSPSPPATTQIKFITSFGGDSDGGSSEGKVAISESKRQTSRQSPQRRSSIKHQSSSHSSRSRSPSYSRSSRRNERRKHSRSRSPKILKSRYRHSPDRKTDSSSRSRDKWNHRYSPSKSCRSTSKHLKPTYSSKHSKLGDVTMSNDPLKTPSPPIRRYYGRRGGSDSDDQNSDSETSHDVSNAQMNYFSSSSIASKSSESTGAKSSINKPTPQELLRRKMQVLLKKQYKEDKKVQLEKAHKAEQERLEREEELRGISIKMRRRERERRHRMQGTSDSDSESRSPSPKRWHENEEIKSRDKEYVKESLRDDYRRKDVERETYNRRYDRSDQNSDEDNMIRDAGSHRRLVDY